VSEINLNDIHLSEYRQNYFIDKLQQPLTAQTTARPDEPWLPAEAEATWSDSGSVWRHKKLYTQTVAS